MGRAGGACPRVGSAAGGATCCRAGSRAGPAWLPDRAIVESSGACRLGCDCTGSRASRRTGVARLGRTARVGPRLATDGRAVLGQPCRGVVGHPQDRGTRRAARSILGRAAGATTGMGHAFRSGAGAA